MGKGRKSKNSGECLNCRTRKAHRRGICPKCFADLSIREKFPRHPRYGPNSANYRGGTYTDNQSRTWILKHGHPKADGRGYVLEKYLVFEEILGRPLREYEQVRQLDHDPTNLDPANLRIRTRVGGDLIYLHSLEENIEKHEQQVQRIEAWRRTIIADSEEEEDELERELRKVWRKA